MVLFGNGVGVSVVTVLKFLDRFRIVRVTSPLVRAVSVMLRLEQLSVDR